MSIVLQDDIRRLVKQPSRSRRLQRGNCDRRQSSCLGSCENWKRGDPRMDWTCLLLPAFLSHWIKKVRSYGPSIEDQKGQKGADDATANAPSKGRMWSGLSGGAVGGGGALPKDQLRYHSTSRGSRHEPAPNKNYHFSRSPEERALQASHICHITNHPKKLFQHNIQFISYAA